MVSLRFNVKSNRAPQAPALMRRAIAAGFKASEEPILSDMQRRTPVDEGDLRASEKAYSDESVFRLEAGEGLDRPYAEHVHQGARGVPGRPFMRDAIEDGGSIIERNIVDAANREFS